MTTAARSPLNVIASEEDRGRYGSASVVLIFAERDILGINQIVVSFAYVNRLADGLAVPLEDFMEPPEQAP